MACYWQNESGQCLLEPLEREDVIEMLRVNQDARDGIATCDCPSALLYRQVLVDMPLNGDGYPEDRASRIQNSIPQTVTPFLLNLWRTDL